MKGSYYQAKKPTKVSVSAPLLTIMGEEQGASRARIVLQQLDAPFTY